MGMPEAVEKRVNRDMYYLTLDAHLFQQERAFDPLISLEQDLRNETKK
jgi:hypothetical protein